MYNFKEKFEKHWLTKKSNKNISKLEKQHLKEKGEKKTTTKRGKRISKKLGPVNKNSRLLKKWSLKPDIDKRLTRYIRSNLQ